MRYPEIIETLGSFIDIAGVLLIIVGLIIPSVRYPIAFTRLPESYKLYGRTSARQYSSAWRSSWQPTSSGPWRSRRR